jgi:hypothetical protein
MFLPFNKLLSLSIYITATRLYTSGRNFPAYRHTTPPSGVRQRHVCREDPTTSDWITGRSLHFIWTVRTPVTSWERVFRPGAGPVSSRSSRRRENRQTELTGSGAIVGNSSAAGCTLRCGSGKDVAAGRIKSRYGCGEEVSAAPCRSPTEELTFTAGLLSESSIDDGRSGAYEI